MVVTQDRETATLTEGSYFPQCFIIDIFGHSHKWGVWWAHTKVLIDVTQSPFICLMNTILKGLTSGTHGSRIVRFKHKLSPHHRLQVFKGILWKKQLPAILYDFKHGPVKEWVHQGEWIQCRQSLTDKQHSVNNNRLHLMAHIMCC